VQETLLARLLERRARATRRFLVVHEMILEEAAGDWRVELWTLADQSVAQQRLSGRVTKERAERWTRWRAFAKVRYSSDIQLLPYSLVVAD
jgi:hypothetical protein